MTKLKQSNFFCQISIRLLCRWPEVELLLGSGEEETKSETKWVQGREGNSVGRGGKKTEIQRERERERERECGEVENLAEWSRGVGGRKVSRFKSEGRGEGTLVGKTTARKPRMRKLR